jgi:hypothetical protein
MNKFSFAFQNLFESMMEECFLKRITIEDIKKSAWYNGPILSDEELIFEMEERIKHPVSMSMSISTP